MEDTKESSRSEDSKPIKISQLYQEPVLARILGKYRDARPTTIYRVKQDDSIAVDDKHFTVNQAVDFLERHNLIDLYKEKKGSEARDNPDRNKIHRTTEKGKRVHSMLVNREEMVNILNNQIKDQILQDYGA